MKIGPYLGIKSQITYGFEFKLFGIAIRIFFLFLKRIEFYTNPSRPIYDFDFYYIYKLKK